MKLLDIINAQGALGKLLVQPMPFRTSYQLSKIGRKVESDLKFIEKSRLVLLQAHCTEAEQGQYKFETPEAALAFNAVWKELVEIESEAGIVPLAIPEAVLDTLTLSPAEWSQLAPFLVMSEEEEAGEDIKEIA